MSPGAALWQLAAAVAAGSAGWLLVADPAPGRLPRPRSGSGAVAWRARIAPLTAVRVGRWSPAGIGAVLLTVLAAVTLAPIPAAVTAASAYVLLRRWRAERAARNLRRQRADDVDMLRALAAELQSGLAPAAALRAAAQGPGPKSLDGLRGRMLAAAAADALGGDAAEVLLGGADARPPSAALAAAWAVCRQTGGRLAAPVGRIADGAAADLRVAREAEAALASARSSARLLAVLPVAGVLVGAVSGSGSLRVLLFTGLGQLCLLAGVGLDLAGLAWLDRLARVGSA